MAVPQGRAGSSRTRAAIRSVNEVLPGTGAISDKVWAADGSTLYLVALERMFVSFGTQVYQPMARLHPIERVQLP